METVIEQMVKRLCQAAHAAKSGERERSIYRYEVPFILGALRSIGRYTHTHWRSLALVTATLSPLDSLRRIGVSCRTCFPYISQGNDSPSPLRIPPVRRVVTISTLSLHPISHYPRINRCREYSFVFPLRRTGNERISAYVRFRIVRGGGIATNDVRLSRF